MAAHNGTIWLFSGIDTVAIPMYIGNKSTWLYSIRFQDIDLEMMILLVLTGLHRLQQQLQVQQLQQLQQRQQEL